MSGEFAAAAAVTLVTAAMAWTVGQQWCSRRRPYQAAWLVALLMAAFAAACYALFLVSGRPALLFRLYYLFGAALNVAFLGLGSLFLATRRNLDQLVIVLIVASIVMASAIFAAPVDQRQLAIATGAGTHVLDDGPWLPLLVTLNVFGTVCLVGVALLSGVRTWLRNEHRERAVANIIIAAGALTIAGAGSVARLAGAGAFWLIMLVGWTIMFAGFVLTSRGRATAAAGGRVPGTEGRATSGADGQMLGAGTGSASAAPATQTPAQTPARSATEARKEAHLQLTMDGPVQEPVRAGFAAYRLEHNALPELDLDAIDLQTTFMGKSLRAPLLISGMTGGAQRAREINRNLAAAAEQTGIAFMVGSQRAGLETDELRSTYEVRDVAPTILLLGNLGAVQLRRGYGFERCRAAIAMIGADGLALHLNALQEGLQAEGDTTFAGLTERIAAICRDLGRPVLVKEVGWGISSAVAQRLVAAGVSAIDVQGAGGTSWARVEGLRSPNERLRAAAEAFAGWGIPTPECIVRVRAACPNVPLIAGGGIRNGVDVAKALAMGADLASAAHPFLEPASRSVEAVVDRLEQFIFELRLAMFATGSQNLAALRGVPIHRQ